MTWSVLSGWKSVTLKMNAVITLWILDCYLHTDLFPESLLGWIEKKKKMGLYITIQLH